MHQLIHKFNTEIDIDTQILGIDYIPESWSKFDDYPTIPPKPIFHPLNKVVLNNEPINKVIKKESLNVGCTSYDTTMTSFALELEELEDLL